MAVILLAGGGVPTQVFVLSPDDTRLLEALRKGDEAAFMELVDRYQGPMLQLALAYTRSRAVAEEVVQEAWLGVLQGLLRFEARASLKTWIFKIVMNVAKRRGERESRTVPFSSVGDEVDSGEAAVERGRFRGAGDRWPGHWQAPPASWSSIPEDRLISQETLAEVRGAIEALPPVQRMVITLRDVQGIDADEACNVLSLSETNQRVLLHRARSKVRAALERYLGANAE